MIFLILKVGFFIGIQIMEIWEVKITLLALLISNNINMLIIINFILLNLLTIVIGIRYMLLKSFECKNVNILNVVHL
jgi:hypothetical protein